MWGRAVAVGVVLVGAAVVIWVVARSRIPVETTAAPGIASNATGSNAAAMNHGAGPHACAGVKTGTEAGPALQAGPRKLAARPRTEFVTAAEPTPETVACGLGGWYPDAELLTVTANHDNTVTKWTPFFDGIEMSREAVTVTDGGAYVTRFHPEVAPPERPHRDRLVDQSKAVQVASAAGTPNPIKVALFYFADYQQWQLPGTAGTNAMDFQMLVASWRLVFKVENREHGVFVDAYTGAVVQKWNNYTD